MIRLRYLITDPCLLDYLALETLRIAWAKYGTGIASRSLLILSILISSLDSHIVVLYDDELRKLVPFVHHTASNTMAIHKPQSSTVAKTDIPAKVVAIKF